MSLRRVCALALVTLVAGNAAAQQPVDPEAPLPPGHPPLAPPAAPAPSAGSSDGHAPTAEAHADGAMGEPEPEPDRAGPAAQVPRGTIEIEVVDASGEPMAGVGVRLGILFQTVAQGESRSERNMRADAQGKLRFSGLEGGSAYSYRVTVPYAGASYASSPITLHPDMGHYVLLHVYPVVRDIERALVGMRSIVYIAPRDEVFQFEALFRIFNIGSSTWVPQNVVLRLPEGSKAITAQESMSDVRFVPQDGGVRLEGSISPGQHDAVFRFQLPNEHDETLRTGFPLPPHVAEARVIVEAARGMNLTVEGFAAAEPSENENGERVLVTGRQLVRGDDQMRELAITIMGIPTPGPGRWYAVTVALGIALAGLYSAVKRRGDPKRFELPAEDRSAARQLLVEELVRLEGAHVRGDVGPRTYEDARRVLLDALARLEPDPGASAGRTAVRPRKTKASAA